MKAVTRENTKELIEKLRDSAKCTIDKLNQKCNGLSYIPGYVRLMQVAATVLDILQIRIDNLTQERDAAVRDLSGDCRYCKCGPCETCHLQAECGDGHSLWQWRGVPKN